MRVTIKFANLPPCACLAALDKSLSVVWWRWYISVSQLCCYWSTAVSFWVASINVCVCFVVPPRVKKGHNLPRPKKFRQSKSRIKTMLRTFFIWEGLFIMNLYQMNKQSTKFTIWEYWKGCVKKLETTRTFCQQLTDHASLQCTCSHGAVCEGVFSY